MSGVYDEEKILTDDEAGEVGIDSGAEVMTGRSDSNDLKLVPVTESIRYRKRAQSAEKKVEVLAEQLARAKSDVAALGEQLNDIQIEQKLMQKLAIEGAVDIDTGVLIAKSRMKGKTDADLNEVIERLKEEKQYLFGDSSDKGRIKPKKTAGARDRVQNSQVILERAAKKAAVTGNRADLQEYLRMRRSFV